ncbi:MULTISPECIES: hypothetical protein [unclassified Caballeronia]|nr:MULTISPECIES: hypothetical protein [unclassified Caballeronia]EKS70219.1 hypothetical protein BURK_019135 [Burkholderia sp. SJ98]MCE4546519.1 hypothetical protein [Caballeronia sp. PC1]MCE4573008.1 hypothetical protein [Caballeronia sp. CLC5]
MQHASDTLFAFSELRLARHIGIANGLKGRLPSDLPILTSPTNAKTFKAIGTEHESTCFGFGKMAIDDLDILTLRLQLGGTQIYWLADVTDAEVWQALDKWLKRQVVP